MEASAVPTVVILGCGYAGVADYRSTMHHKIGAIPANVHGGKWAERTQIPLASITRYGKCVFGEVAHVDGINNLLVFKDANIPVIKFDVLVCATGTMSYSPGDLPADCLTPQDIKTYFASLSTAFANAKDGLVVGDGATAVECAGEIKAKHPLKNVTMVSSGNLLASCMLPLSTRFLRKVNDKLIQISANVILGGKVVRPSQHEFTHAKYQTNCTVETMGMKSLKLHADLVIWAASWEQNCSIFPVEWCNEVLELQCTNTFQLQARPDVFAVGDVSSLSETKQAVTLLNKIKFVTHNILQVACAAKHPHRNILKLKHYAMAQQAKTFLPLGPSWSLINSGLCI